MFSATMCPSAGRRKSVIEIRLPGLRQGVQNEAPRRKQRGIFGEIKSKAPLRKRFIYSVGCS